MSVTLDTNVLVSAFISRDGTCADVLDLISTFEEIHLVLSEEILSEFEEVMKRNEVKSVLGYRVSDIVAFRVAVRGVAEIVKVKSAFKAVEEDPEDDTVVNTAIDGKAQYIVSGDKHLCKLKKFRGVSVVTPKGFLRLVAKRFGELILSKDDFIQ